MGKTAKSPTADSSIESSPVIREKKIEVRYVIFALFALAVPLIVSIIVIAQRRWYPANLDFAWTEFRVRDVGTSRSPLIGLPGRIGTLERQGSHPGPLSFYLLAPLYRLLGSSTWALRTSVVGLNFAGLVAALLIARRRSGAFIFLGVVASAALLVHFLGASVLTMPWNPYMPVMWWLVFLLAAWSVLLDDLPMLPVAAASGAFCVQTHISYLGLVGGVGSLVVGWIGFSAFRRKGSLGEHPWRWVGASAALLVALFTPVLWDQLTNKPGNLSIIWEYFTAPPEASIGLRRALAVLLANLNPVQLILHPLRLFTGESAVPDPIIPGLIFLAIWGSSFYVAIKRRIRELVLFDTLILLALLLGLLSTARIFGFAWFYLVLWAWVISALMLVATCWSLIVVVAARLSIGQARTERVLRVAVILTTLLLLAFSSLDAINARESTASVSDALGDLVRPTIRALNSGEVIGGGKSGNYLVEQTYAFDFDETLKGFVDELERAGFKAGSATGAEVKMTPERTIQRGLSSAVLHIAVGPDIAVWRRIPGAVEIAYSSSGTSLERKKYEQLILALNEQVPKDELAGALAKAYSPDSKLSAAARRTIIGMQNTRLPQGVFIAKPTVGLSDFEAAQSAYPLAPAQYRRLAERAPENKKRVLVVGDAVVWSFGYKSLMPFRGANSWIMNWARKDCAIVPGNFAFFAFVYEQSKEEKKFCGEWPKGVSDAVSGFKPDETVLLPSGSETYDREINGVFYRFGTQKYADLIWASLKIALSQATASNGALSVVAIPCADPTASAVPQLGGLRRETMRITWVNGIFESFAKAHPTRVRLLNMDGLVCPDGTATGTPEGLAIRPDGENYSAEGVRKVLEWLDSKIQRSK